MGATLLFPFKIHHNPPSKFNSIWDLFMYFSVLDLLAVQMEFQSLHLSFYSFTVLS